MTGREYVRAGWCHWHKGPAGTLALINVIEPRSVGQYACADCRARHGLTPAVEISLEEWIDAQTPTFRRLNGVRVADLPPGLCDVCGTSRGTITLGSTAGDSWGGKPRYGCPTHRDAVRAALQAEEAEIDYRLRTRRTATASS